MGCAEVTTHVKSRVYLAYCREIGEQIQVTEQMTLEWTKKQLFNACKVFNELLLTCQRCTKA